MDTLRIAIVGIGNIGSYHAKNLFNNEIDSAELVALSDIDSNRLHWAEKELSGIPAFKDYKEMFDKIRPQAVIIATPHYVHEEVAVAAFSRRIHVLCEKPIGAHLAQGIRMVEASRQADVVFSMMYNQRANPIFKKMKELTQSEELGKSIRLCWMVNNWYRTQSYYDSAIWRATWHGEGGGVLLNQAVHNLDIWQWIFGMPNTIQGVCEIGHFHNIEVEDDATILANYNDGRKAVFITSTGEFPGTNRLEISFENGKLVAENNQLKIYRNNSLKTDFSVEVFQPDVEETAHIGILQNFVNCILQKEPLICPGEDGLNALSIINAAYLSSWQGKKIQLPLDHEAYYGELITHYSDHSAKMLKKNCTNQNGNFCTRWDVKW